LHRAAGMFPPNHTLKKSRRMTIHLLICAAMHGYGKQRFLEDALKQSMKRGLAIMLIEDNARDAKLIEAIPRAEDFHPKVRREALRVPRKPCPTNVLLRAVFEALDGK
jgi:hypothetical protein